MAKKTSWRPPLSPSPCAPNISQVYSNDRAAFRLVVASSHPAGAIEIQGLIALSILFLFRSIRRPKRRVDGHPYAFHPFESSLQCPPHRRRYYLVGFYVSLSNGGHRRPVLHPSLNFSMGAISTPQTRGKHAERASPGAWRLY